MSISLSEFRRRYTSIRELMQKNSMDCLLVVGLSDDFSRGNIRYLTGSGRGGHCIFPAEGSPVVLTNPNQSSSSKLPRTIPAFPLLEFKETANVPDQVLSEIARFDRGNKIGVVGLSSIAVAVYEKVREKMEARIINAGGLFEQVRAIKSPEEIEKIRQAAAVADRVYYRLREIMKPDLSDYEIFAEVKGMIYRLGCEYSFDLMDAKGVPMNMAFFPLGDKLEEGKALFMEISPAFEGYYAQLPVTLPVGTYSSDVLQMAKAWNRADQAARELLRPGTKVSDIYLKMMEAIQKSGFISPLRPGHSIGLDILDFWSITESNQITLQAGMTLAVHPCCMARLFGEGVGMGYTYLITERGADRLSSVDLARELGI